MMQRDLVRLAAMLVLFFALTGCAAQPTVIPTASPIPPTNTPEPSSTPTPTNTPSATEIQALTIVFYGDSVLKVGEVGRQGEVGFSFVDDLRPALEPPHTLVTVNYGGRNARWAAATLEENVLSLNPDVVSLWWSMNDLYGCPGIFDRDTNRLLQYQLDAYVEEHIQSMRSQIDSLLEKNIPVYVMTPIPVSGELPWSHSDENLATVWETNRWCDYNLGLEQLAAAEREMVSEYAAAGQPVHLVDAWQVYKDHPDTEKMYMDVVHPASNGAALVAEEWLRVFEENQR